MVVSLSVDCPGHAFRNLSSRFEVAALQALCPCVMLFVSCLVSSSSQRSDPETLVMLCVDVMLCVADPVSFFCPLHCVLLSTAVTLPVWILPGSNLPVMTPISSIASRSVFVTRHTHEHADYDAVRRQSSLSLSSKRCPCLVSMLLPGARTLRCAVSRRWGRQGHL